MVQSGGMVVKNVAGLDMAKLMIGSFGTLAAIAVLFGIKSFVPKTRDTIVLLDRVLFRDEELRDLSKQEDSSAVESLVTAQSPQQGRRGGMRGGQGPGPGGSNASTFFTSQIEADRERPLWWIIGTSLLFEAACVALAAWHFCTRDF